ncbi:MAG TPA: 4'-phosphopantetheinyl transferase superfamily protein [Chthoniobacterales bacterium]|nr:4'-phosphopantetheinyl transferase superfamily protein [Chthoniobacterales bacterium]
MKGLQIWQAHLEALSAAQMEKLDALLDPAERARAARFHFAADRKHYIASHGLLRHLLSTISGKPPPTLVIEYGAHGKPALTPDAMRPLCFNLSHSAGWAFFAFAWDGEVGIDLESEARLERDENTLLGLATRVLSQRELVIWRTLGDITARRAAFLRAWTRKEALAKARGQGLSSDVRQFEVALDAAAPKSSLKIQLPRGEGEGVGDWILHDLAAPDGFAAALVVEEKAF